MKKTLLLFILISGFCASQIKQNEINKELYKKIKNEKISNITLDDGTVLNVGDSLVFKRSGFSSIKIVTLQGLRLTAKSSNIYLTANVSPGAYPSKEDIIPDLISSINDKSIVLREKNMRVKYRAANVAIVDRSKKDSIVSVLKAYGTKSMNDLSEKIQNIESLENDSKIVGISYMEYNDSYIFTAESNEKFDIGFDFNELNNNKITKLVKYKNGLNNDSDVTLTAEKTSKNFKEIDYKVLKNIVEYVLIDTKYSLKNQATFIPLSLNLWMDINKKWNVRISYSGQNDYGGLKDANKIYQFDQYGFLLSKL